MWEMNKNKKTKTLQLLENKRLDYDKWAVEKYCIKMTRFTHLLEKTQTSLASFFCFVFVAFQHSLACTMNHTHTHTQFLSEVLDTLYCSVTLNKSPWVSSVFKSPLHWGVHKISWQTQWSAAEPRLQPPGQTNACECTHTHTHLEKGAWEKS